MRLGLAGLITLSLSTVLHAQDPAPVRLEWKLRKGDVLRYESTSILESFGGKGEWGFRYRWEVLDWNAIGTATIKMTFERVRTPEFDSAKQAIARESDLVGRYYSAYMGKSLTFRLTRQGEYLNVDSKDLDAAARNAMKEELRDLEDGNSDKPWKQLLDLMTGGLPPEPVRIGSTWKKAGKDLVEFLQLTTTFTLGEVVGSKAVVAESSVIELKPPSKGTPSMESIKIKESKADYKVTWVMDKGHLESRRGESRHVIEMGGRTITLSSQEVVELVR